jgi:hypothetical protein
MFRRNVVLPSHPRMGLRNWGCVYSRRDCSDQRCGIRVDVVRIRSAARVWRLLLALNRRTRTPTIRRAELVENAFCRLARDNRIGDAIGMLFEMITVGIKPPAGA